MLGSGCELTRAAYDLFCSGEEMMGHRGLNINQDEIGELLSTEQVEDLQQRYITTLHSNIAEWMSNSMATDKKVPNEIWTSKSMIK